MGESTHSSHCDGVRTLAFRSNRYDCRYDGLLAALLTRKASNSFISRTSGCRFVVASFGFVVVVVVVVDFDFGGR
jgi:hypothetical protein